MKPRRSYRLLLVNSTPPKQVTERHVLVSNPRRAVRKVLKQLVGIEAVHVVFDGRLVRTMEFGK
jgi:hypothetical protein